MTEHTTSGDAPPSWRAEADVPARLTRTRPSRELAPVVPAGRLRSGHLLPIDGTVMRALATLALAAIAMAPSVPSWLDGRLATDALALRVLVVVALAWVGTGALERLAVTYRVTAARAEVPDASPPHRRRDD